MRAADLLLYLAIGAVEWALALNRAVFIIRGRRLAVAVTLFLEQVLGLWVIALLLVGREAIDLAGVVAYGLGGALAALLTIKPPKRRPAMGACDPWEGMTPGEINRAIEAMNEEADSGA